MSNTPAPDPAGPAPESPGATPTGAPEADAPAPAARRKAALIFDDPLNQQSSDDTDRGWGDRPAASGGAADLARFLDEKPPHHL
ncbi:hypothetical protein ACIBK8_10625 [Streptomyces sp. NPDC050161]|uniref:hypothetical protein n=1 Tax=Streptomyces sp. NPDC050161 TaxID=3365604 RepID=UPI00379C160C